MKAPSKTDCVRILLVGESRVRLKTLSRILAKEGGFTVVGIARDGCQALHHTLALAPELVLIDQHLPQLNGAQAAQYIKHFAKPPVVFMVTADDSPGSRSKGEAAGADAFVVQSAGLRSLLKLRFQKWLDPEAEHLQAPGKLCHANDPAAIAVTNE